jgi:hypothetical protein
VTGVSGKYRVTENSATYTMTLELERGENPMDILEYRYAAGYDLFDRGIEVEGDRKNPILKIDEVMVEQHEVPQNIPGGEPEASTGTLTQEAVNIIKAGYKKWKSTFGANGTYGDGGNGYDYFGVSEADLIKAIASCKVNPNVITAVIQAESTFDTWAVSSTGCSGLGQFCINTARTGNPCAIFLATGKEFYYQGNEEKTKDGHKIKNKNDARFEPIANVKAIDALLIQNGFNNGGVKSKREALRVYGDNQQTEYTSIVLRELKKIEPSNPLLK